MGSGGSSFKRMKCSLRLWLVIFIWGVGTIGSPLYAAAQEEAWSFEQLVRQAIATHPSILAKRSSAVAAQADLRTATWQRYPALTVESSTEGLGDTPSATVVRVQQPLWTGGRITAGIDAASSRRDAAESLIKETKDEVTFKVIAAYVEAAHQQARQEAALLNVTEHEKLLGMIDRRVIQEVSPAVDKDLAESRLYQARNELSLSRQILAQALAQLAQLTGKPVAQVLDIKENEDFPLPESRDLVLKQALARLPTLQRLAAEEQAAAADVTSSKALWWPQAVARFDRRFGHYPDDQAMLVVEMQPGAGLSSVSAVSAARAKQDAARQAQESALRDLYEQISVDWNEFQGAQGRLRYSLLARQKSAGISDSYARQYTAGRKSWLDVLNAVREATYSEYAVADVAAQLHGARFRLRLLSGELWASQIKQD